MSDYNSSLPVRTQNNGDVVAKLVDGTTTTQYLSIDASGHVSSNIYASNGDALTDHSGALDVYVTNTIPVTVGVVDESTFTYGTSLEQPIGGVYQDTSPTLTAGQTGAVRLTEYRGFHVNLRTSAGAELGNSNADALWAQIGNGTNALSISAAGEALVDLTSAAFYGSVSGGTAGSYSGLAGGIYNSSAPSLTNGQQAALQLDASGYLLVDGSKVTQPISGTVTADQGGAPWSFNLTEVGGSAVALGQAAMAASIPVVIASNQSAVASNITELGGSAPSATNALPAQIATAGAYVSSSNPLPVEIINPSSEGTFKNYYTDSSSVASGTTVTQSTTVGGTNGFYLQSFLVAGSGKFKAQVQIETASGSGIFNVFWTCFNSTASPNQQVAIPNNTLVPTGARIQVLMTNNDLASQDLYSTVMGYQI